MPRTPRWTALPATLDALLARMVNVQTYPERPGLGRARCSIRQYATLGPDPHDWRLWRAGRFGAWFEGRPQLWSLRLRRCSGCKAVEVREERWRPYMPSARGRRTYAPSREEELLGYYRGTGDTQP